MKDSINVKTEDNKDKESEINENEMDKPEDITHEEQAIDGNIHEKDEDKKQGYTVESMIAYVNNSEIVESYVEKVTDDTVESDPILESPADKQHRMDVIGLSLTISKLEDELDEAIKQEIDVKDTEERIRRLHKLLSLLKGKEVWNSNEN